MKSRRMIAIVLCLFLIGTTLTAEYVPLKINLTILERLMLGNMLPKETSFANWKIINDLKDQLAPTEAEVKTLDARPAPEGGGTVGNWNLIPDKEITFGETTEKMIVESLKKLDRDEKLLPEHLTLYEKFIEKK